MFLLALSMAEVLLQEEEIPVSNFSLTKVLMWCILFSPFFSSAFILFIFSGMDFIIVLFLWIITLLLIVLAVLNTAEHLKVRKL